MRSVVPMKTAKIGYIVVSLMLCVLGGVFIAVPDFSAELFGVLCGVIMIVFGIVRLVGYFSKDLYRLAFQYDLAFGILIIALGAIMLCHPNGLMHFICVTLGFAFLADGLFKIQIAVDAKKFGIYKWWLILSLAILTGVFGILMIARPDGGSRVLSVLVGISMLCEGVLNISTVITAVKIIKHQNKNVIRYEDYIT